MRQLSITPSITVTIGRHTRIYYAFVTTAPPALDSPNTITLDEGRFADIVGLARDQVSRDDFRGPMPARLVLVDAMQRAWQEAKYAGKWELPVLGEVVAPAAVLIRPDGYVAWAGERAPQGLWEALTTWFGTPGNAREPRATP